MDIHRQGARPCSRHLHPQPRSRCWVVKARPTRCSELAVNLVRPPTKPLAARPLAAPRGCRRVTWPRPMATVRSLSRRATLRPSSAARGEAIQGGGMKTRLCAAPHFFVGSEVHFRSHRRRFHRLDNELPTGFRASSAARVCKKWLRAFSRRMFRLRRALRRTRSARAGVVPKRPITPSSTWTVTIPPKKRSPGTRP